MLSGVENVLYLKKCILNKTKQEYNIILALYVGILFPALLFLDALIIYFFSLAHIYYNNEWSFLLFVWIIIFLILTNVIFNYFFLSLSKQYLLSSNAKIIIEKNPEIIDLYNKNIKKMLGLYLYLNFKDNDYNQFNNVSPIETFLIIEKTLGLTPSNFKNIDDYYIKSLNTYKKIDEIF